MKKVLPTVMVIALLLLLAGCSVGQPTIKHVELTDAEQQLVKAVGGDRVLRYMVDAEIGVDITVKWVMEHYYQGKKTDDVLAAGMVTNGEKPGLPIYFSSSRLVGSNEEIWNLAVGEAGMTKRVTTPGSDYAFAWEPVQQSEFKLDVPIVMAIGVYSGETLHGIPEGVFNDEMAMEQLLKNEHVYILKMTFSEGE